MALILHIETASDICSVALANEQGLIDLRENTEGKSHASILTVFIDDILKTNKVEVSNLGAVAVSMGPGSYTGLRIGVSASKGLCYGANIPLLGLSTLQCMSYGFINEYRQILETNTQNVLLCPMLDARRLEVYTAFLTPNSEFASEIKAEIINESSFSKILEEHIVYFFGNGSDKCSEIITHPNARFISKFVPSARDMIVLSQELFTKKDFKDVAYFEPFYLKDFVATTPKNKVLG